MTTSDPRFPGVNIIPINGKTPRNVDDAVAVIKQAGNQIKVRKKAL